MEITTESQDSAPRLLTRRDVGERLGVSDDTIRRWVASGRLAELRTPGGRCRYRQADIAALLVPSRTAS